MILSCQNISKAFGTDVILKQASFHIEDHEKAAIVGINGAGKTTLLRIIVGEMEPDEGVVALSKGKTIGYLEQHQDVHSEQTIYEELLSVKEDVLRMHAFRRPENACCTRPPAPLLTGSSSARRADQPSGSEFNRMAGKLSDEL